MLPQRRYPPLEVILLALLSLNTSSRTEMFLTRGRRDDVQTCSRNVPLCGLPAVKYRAL